MPPPWRPRNPPTTWPSRQRPGIQGSRAGRGIPPQHRAILPLPGSAIRLTILATHPRKETFAPPSFPHPPSFPYPHSVIPAKAGIHGGGAARGIPPQSRRASDPRGVTQRSPKTGIQGGGAPRGIPRRRPSPPLMTHSDVTLPTHSHTSVAQPPRESGHPARRSGAGHPPKRHSAPPPKLPRPGNNQTPKAIPKLRGGFPPASNQLFSTLLASQPPQKKCLRNHAKVNNQPDHMPTIRRAGHPSRACTAAHPSTAIHRATSA